MGNTLMPAREVQRGLIGLASGALGRRPGWGAAEGDRSRSRLPKTRLPASLAYGFWPPSCLSIVVNSVRRVSILSASEAVAEAHRLLSVGLQLEPLRQIRRADWPPF
jgi:hypothetical protein